jgi:hypothetical protein
MELQDKLDLLREFEREDDFRQELLMPLFNRMKLRPRHTHGTTERGKDIVCRTQSALGFDEWIAIVAKVGAITGTAGGSSGFRTVLHQVTDAFGFPYNDPKSKTRVSINEVIVVTNAQITSAAEDSIVNDRSVPPAMRANTHFLSAPDLVDLIDGHWQAFWNTMKRKLATLPNEWMTHATALVLYVVARTHILAARGARKKLDRELTREQIQRQTRLSRTDVDAAVSTLLKWEYLEEVRRRKAKMSYRLHTRQTAGRLITSGDEATLLLRIEGSLKNTLRFTKEDAVHIAQKHPLFYDPSFVARTIGNCLRGEYITRDETRSGRYKLNVSMLDDERRYLGLWMKHDGASPIERR